MGMILDKGTVRQWKVAVVKNMGLVKVIHLMIRFEILNLIVGCTLLKLRKKLTAEKYRYIFENLSV